MKSLDFMAATFDLMSKRGLDELDRYVMDLKSWTVMGGRECLNTGQEAMSIPFLNTTAPSALTLCSWWQYKIL